MATRRPCVIRRARSTDAAPIAHVHCLSWRVSYRGLLDDRYLRQLCPGELEGRWRRIIGHGHGSTRRRDRVWVADAGGQVVGFAQSGSCGDQALLGFAGEVYMLYLDPNWWGRGLGRQLLAHTLDDLERSGFFWVVIAVLEGNERARSFYRRQGFRHDGARWIDRLSGVARPVVRMARAINELPIPSGSTASA